jgi:hypothetical protein
MFGGIAGGWQRVQAICDYVHARMNSDTTMPDVIGLRPKGIRSASAFAATSRTWRSLFAVP